MVPSEQLAVTAGIDTDNGIVVDDYCRTSRSDVYAIGDVTRHPDGRTGGLRRLESMANAAAQARVAADHFMGVDAPYHDVPWFWSDQYDVKLQTAGLMGDFDELVVRGEPQHDKKFCVLYLKEGKIQAVDAVSSPADFAIGKRLVEGRVQVDPAELADVQNPLRSFLPPGATRKA
jgi:3-phenylpropionate/trans-cinnamate dioxygenase ferredoxin reductase subunit